MISTYAQGGDSGDVWRAGIIGAGTAWLGSQAGSQFLSDGFGPIAGRIVGSAINGYLQTGTAEGALRGAASGLIPNDFGFGRLYLDNGFANIAIGVARDGIRGAIVGGRNGVARGIALGQVTNAFGHIYGFAVSGQAPVFRDGVFHYLDSGPFIGKQYGAITFGNTVSGPQELYVKLSSDVPVGSRWIDTHERGHVFQAQLLGALYLPVQAISQWIGGSIFGSRGVFLEWGPLHPHGYETAPR